MPQGSGTSIHGETIGRGTESLSHLLSQHNLDKECSLSPPNTAIVSEAIAMDIDDVPRPTNAPAAS